MKKIVLIIIFVAVFSFCFANNMLWQHLTPGITLQETINTLQYLDIPYLSDDDGVMFQNSFMSLSECTHILKFENKILKGTLIIWSCKDLSDKDKINKFKVITIPIFEQLFGEYTTYDFTESDLVNYEWNNIRLNIHSINVDMIITFADDSVMITVE